jgi:hypothetical protein
MRWALLALAFCAAQPALAKTSARLQAPESAARLCERIEARLASVAAGECAALHLRETAARSTRGTPLLSRDYPSTEAAPKARVLLIGGIHGDELSSISVVLKWMRLLERGQGLEFHWRVLPLANPDGLFARPRAQRTNARGVDLNRNFNTGSWQVALNDYWAGRTGRNPRLYPGPQAESEPETRWLRAQIEDFRPDAIISVHAPHGVVDFDGPPVAPEKLGELRLGLLGTYPGSLGNFAGAQRGIQVVTLELPHAGIMPKPAQIETMWHDLAGWLAENARLRAARREGQ